MNYYGVMEDIEYGMIKVYKCEREQSKKIIWKKSLISKQCVHPIGRLKNVNK